MSEVELPEVETTDVKIEEVGNVESFETNSIDFKPNALSELVRHLNKGAEYVASAEKFALPGDKSILVGLAVQIESIAELFVTAAEEAVKRAQEEQETLPLVEEED